MGVFISAEDFSGKYAIPQSVFTDLDAFIDDTEESYVVDLLGAELYKDFKEKFEADPLFPDNPGYKQIYDSFNIDGCNTIVKSKGLKIMLFGFLFFDFMRQNGYQATAQGMVINTPDTSMAAPKSNLFSYLNEAVDSYKAIQYYIVSYKPELFPPEIEPKTVSFNGQYLGYSNPVFG